MSDLAVTRALYPLKLLPSFRTKIWGNRDLSPIFGVSREPVGEAWYTFEENVIANGDHKGRRLGELIATLGEPLMGRSFKPSGLRRRSAGEGVVEGGISHTYFPILAKLLFTAEKLSLQVHPDDDYALRHEGGPGKTEMWYVVRAAPRAAIALGLSRRMTPGEMSAAAQDGTIEESLRWVPVETGQTFFIPPGTLHAIGPGLVLCEVQQNSDLTYRFFDFGRLGDDGRPRPLHIEQAVAVTKQDAHPGPASPFRFRGAHTKRELLAACPYFAVERLCWKEGFDYRPEPEHADILIFLRGNGVIGGHEYHPGVAYLIPAEAPAFNVQVEVPTDVIRAYVPDLDKLREELRGAGGNEEEIQSLVRS